MNPQVMAYLPLVAPVATLVVVTLGVFFSNHHVDTRISDLNTSLTALIKAESARLEAVLKLDIGLLAARVKALEERAGPIYTARG
jgi:hypothetical protein